ncbi:MAG: phosphoribosylanthranilate isomerase [Lachnospiraceae bacterium]|nr:phosphoribosylanthranilate isomerase [Lachnospiraceae bacterium]
MVKIKICGLKSTEDVEIVNKYKPDYVGFVFAGTKRFVSDELAKEMKQLLDSNILSVGVFVNDDVNHIKKLADNSIIDLIQLHGDEDQNYIDTLRTLTDKPIIKAVRMKDETSIQNALSINPEYYLLDSYDKTEYGGTGKTFDTNLINQKLDYYFLAGGLNESNILDTLQKCSPYCVDISSGVETNGFKDETKIKNIINLIRNNY